MEYEMKKMSVNNVTYNYDYFGQGNQTIVFISGYTCDIHLWKPVADVLQKTNRVLIFDNQGIGDTHDNGEVLTIESMANNVYELINKLEIKKPTLVGYAMGSTIALQIAKKDPDTIAKLILLSPVLSWSSRAIKYIDTLIQLRKDADHDTYFELLYKTAFGSAYKANTSLEAFKDIMKSVPQSQTMIDQERQATALKLFNCRKWIGNITTPIIILSPKEDQFATPEEASEFKENASDVTIVPIECGHAALAESPNIVIDLCVRYASCSWPGLRE
jgi:pimeloyl-ACP methyl ester carboxylesterase